MEHSDSGVSVAWISRGRLFVRKSGQPLKEIESDFAREALAREIRDSQLNSWKGRSGVWGNLGMQPPGAAPWEDPDPRRQIRFAAVARGKSADEVLYVLDMGVVGGLFSYDLREELERRLVHRQGFLLRDISRHPHDGELVVSLPREDRTVGLRVTRADGLFGKDIAVSDAIDESPAWLPDGTKRLVFQSAAIARNEHGYAVGTSPFRIEMLDLEAEQLQTVYEEEGYDLLQPRMQPDGSLLCIRRPHQQQWNQPAASVKDVLLDVVCFPYRVLRTGVHFLHFLSMMFSGKPLISAGGPAQRRGQANPVLMLWGQAVDTQRILSRDRSGNPATPLVPETWQLIHRAQDGAVKTLASHVMAWDMNPDGTLVWTNGRTIWSQTPGRNPAVVTESDIVERLALLG